jgi:multidrug efflux pump subunit AcrB
VDVRLALPDKDTLGDVEALRVTLPGGRQAPLDAVATLSTSRGFARIARVDGVRTVTIEGDVDTDAANTAELNAAFRDELAPKLLEDHPSVGIEYEGEAKETALTRDSMARGSVVGVLGVFVLLSFQFRSYLEPLVVMAAIPFALIGVIWGHVLMGAPLTMPSALGFVSLAGVVVNDSILLVQFIKLERREGNSLVDAARHASRRRFRAVMLTSVTTVVGLLPLLTETSLQAQVLIPLAASIVFGILASTVLVLLLVPALYTLLGDFGLVERAEAASATG